MEEYHKGPIRKQHQRRGQEEAPQQRRRKRDQRQRQNAHDPCDRYDGAHFFCLRDVEVVVLLRRRKQQAGPGQSALEDVRPYQLDQAPSLQVGSQEAFSQPNAAACVAQTMAKFDVFDRGLFVAAVIEPSDRDEG